MYASDSLTKTVKLKELKFNLTLLNVRPTMNLLRKFKENLILTSDDNLVVWHDGAKKVLKVPEAPLNPKVKKGDVEEVRRISCAAVSKNQNFLAICLQNKQLVVYDGEFNVTMNVLTNRGVSSVKFGRSDELLIADKTGDVFVYDFKTHNQPRLILGHLSMLLDIALSEDEKFVITCDRDEKIRVSHYPNAYNIASYCLGHEEFVVKLEMVDNILISASGDGSVRFWNYLDGRQLYKINTNEHSSSESVLEFCKKLEDVQVNALPVIDLQAFKSGSVFVGVTVYGSNGVQLYRANIKNDREVTVTFLETVTTLSTIIAFHLSENLFVLNKDEFLCYRLNGDLLTIVRLNEFANFYESCKIFLYEENNFNISTYYKRKYDNVQDYLERKRMRLENAH